MSKEKMKIVVDANVIISALASSGVSRKVFLINSLIKKFEFIAPELLLKEVRKREESLIKEIGISKEEWNEILNFILEEIDFIPADEFIHFLPEAEKICKDSKDK